LEAFCVVHKLPNDLQKAIVADPLANTLWESFTPLAGNEWICWVTSAKKSETRIRRIKIGIDKMRKGMRRPCCWPGCPHRWFVADWIFRAPHQSDYWGQSQEVIMLFSSSGRRDIRPLGPTPTQSRIPLRGLMKLRFAGILAPAHPPLAQSSFASGCIRLAPLNFPSENYRAAGIWIPPRKRTFIPSRSDIWEWAGASLRGPTRDPHKSTHLANSGLLGRNELSPLCTDFSSLQKPGTME